MSNCEIMSPLHLPLTFVKSMGLCNPFRSSPQLATTSGFQMSKPKLRMACESDRIDVSKSYNNSYRKSQNESLSLLIWDSVRFTLVTQMSTVVTGWRIRDETKIWAST